MHAGVSFRRERPPYLEMTSWQAPDGWRLRRFHAPAIGTPRGTLLFLGGRGDFIEKYIEAIDSWRGSGWTVLGFDWRGQGGSGELLPGKVCHIDDFADFLADLTAFAEAALAGAPRPHVGIGHSMGGHLLLRALVEARLTLDGVVLAAPMQGLRTRPFPRAVLPLVARLGCMPGLRTRPLWSGADSPRPGQVTSCPDRREDKLWWKQAHPELGRGAPSWGWVTAACRSIRTLDRALPKAALDIPALLLIAGRDAIVDAAAIERTARAIPGAAVHRIDGAGHELLREADGPRLTAMRHIAWFLEDRAPGQRGPTPIRRPTTMAALE